MDDPIFEQLAAGSASLQVDNTVSDPIFDRLANMMEQATMSPYELAREQYKGVKEPNILQKIGRGFTDVKDGINQLWLDTVNPEQAQKFQSEKDAELGIYDAGVGEGFDAPRFIGQVLGTSPTMMLPGGRETLLGKMFAGALEGGIAGGSLYTREGESKISNAMMGMLGGAAVPAAFSGTGLLAGKLTSGAKTIGGKISNAINFPNKVALSLQQSGIDFNALSREMQDRLVGAAKEQVDVSGNIDTDALTRKLRAEELGFTGDRGPTMGQITRSPNQWQRERNMMKQDDEAGAMLTSRFQNQDARWSELRDEVIGDVPDVEQIESAQVVIDAVKGHWKSSQDAVSKLYTEVRKAKGDQGGIVIDDLLQRLDAESVDGPAEAIVRGIRNKIEKLGYMDRGQFTINQAEGLRKWINQIPDGNDPNIQRLKRGFIDHLDDDVINSAGDDAFKQARDAARERFKKFSTKLVKGIVDDKTEPQRLINAIKSASPQNIKSLRDNLMVNDEGAQAWERVRQQVITDMWEKSSPASGGFSGSNFQKQIKGFQVSRLKEIFSKEELSKLLQIAEVGGNMTVTPPYSAVNWSNTTPALYNMLKNSGGLPLLGDYLRKSGERNADLVFGNNALAGGAIDPGMLKGIEASTRAKFDNFLFGQPYPFLGSPAKMFAPAAGLLSTQTNGF